MIATNAVMLSPVKMVTKKSGVQTAKAVRQKAGARHEARSLSPSRCVGSTRSSRRTRGL